MSRRRKPDLFATPPAYINVGSVELGNDLLKGQPRPPAIEPVREESPWEVEEQENFEAFVGTPAPLVPTPAEVAALPRAAALAFAAQCARRVLPLYAATWTAAPDELRDAVRRAVEVAEDAAAGPDARAAAAFAAAGAADAAARAGADVAFQAGRTAARAAGGDEAFVAAHAARSAADTLVRAADTRTPITRQLRAIRRDFDRLVQMVQGTGWTDETPVAAGAFGPMWVVRPPAWWPAGGPG